MPRLFTNAIRREPKPWAKPTFSMPMQIDPGSLTELGVDPRGSRWFSHRQYGELQAARLIPEEHEPGNVLLTEVRKDDGETYWQTYSVHAPGSYQAALEYRTVAKAKPAHRVVSALGPFPILSSTPGRNGKVHPAVRGAANIDAHLRARDVHGFATAVPGRITFTTPKGQDTIGLDRLAAVLSPLLYPHYMGGKSFCQVTDHAGDLVEATDVAVGGIPHCGRCLPS